MVEVTRRWFTAIPSVAVPPLAVPVNPPSVVQTSARAGIRIPPRRSDCAGRPSWYPFQINVCDVDEPSDVPLAGRQLTVPGWPGA